MLFPHFKDSLGSLEIVRVSAIDTMKGDGTTLLAQDITLTCFDSGQYEIPALTFYGRDSQILAVTNAIPLEVNTIEVDTTAMIKGIKAPLSAPLTWKEIGNFVLIGIAAILLIVGLVWLAYHLGGKKKSRTAMKTVPKEAAHLIALRALENLKEKKLWQQNEYKAYYSELTEILRTYLFNRWEISAMEMVSDEILQALRPYLTDPTLLEKLQKTLQTADGVKFAKATPLPDENMQSYQWIYELVEATQLRETPANNPTGGNSHA